MLKFKPGTVYRLMPVREVEEDSVKKKGVGCRIGLLTY